MYIYIYMYATSIHPCIHSSMHARYTGTAWRTAAVGGGGRAGGGSGHSHARGRGSDRCAACAREFLLCACCVLWRRRYIYCLNASDIVPKLPFPAIALHAAEAGVSDLNACVGP